MKIRIYSPYFPFPITEGAFQVIYDQVRCFVAKGHSVELVFWLEGSNSKSRQDLGMGARVRVHDFSALCKKAKKGRAWRVFRSLVGNFASPELFYYPPSADQRDSLEEVDLAIYHFSFSYVWLKRARPAREKRVVVHFHNLEHELFDLRANQFSCMGDPRKWIHRRNRSLLRQHEWELKTLADELWFVSPMDLERYGLTRRSDLGTDLVGERKARLRSVGPTFDSDILMRRRLLIGASASKPIFGFLGNLEFGPNHESVKWILEKVAPLLQENGFLGKILIVGKNPSLSLKKAASRYSFVEFTGFLEEIETFWGQISFLLIPHITGSGVRIKLLEALASNIPVLANSAAIGLIHPELQKQPQLFCRDDPSEWARLILSETPMKTRLQFQSLPFAPALEGEKIYGFLEEIGYK